MKPDKVVKAEFREIASKQPQKHFPVDKLKKLGFSRRQCTKCQKFFWSVAERKVCGDAACSGGYTFIGNSPAKKKLDYIESWKAFEKFFEKLGYLSLPRKPVVARWRDDVYWVGASVYGFQPYVVSGEIKPPSNAVIIPQLSLRFNDVDNVGITGSHYVCFDMLGQLHFEPKQKYNVAEYLHEYFEWITNGMGVPAEELQLHEDAWAGGGNFGPCIEFFSRGCEIGNQVYMQYKQTDSGNEELDIKVLDMGQGHERVPWFTTGKATSYETTFPTVVDYLRKETGVKGEEKTMQKFLPYAAYLNVDEVEDINEAWQFVAGKIGLSVEDARRKVLHQAAIYSIAEHSRAALVALTDGALPSNVGGGYNLRTILRRMFDFLEHYTWQVDFEKIMKLHAKFLKPIYPELDKSVEEVLEILENERKKYGETKERSMQIVEKLTHEHVTTEKLIELYDSHGISPELVKTEFSKRGHFVNVPDNFFALVAEKHEQKEQATQTRKDVTIDLSGLPETEVIYYSNYKLNEFEGTVLRVMGDKVVLDTTAFYPTSGGQMHDLGKIAGIPVVDVFKIGTVIVHALAKPTGLKTGEVVTGQIDFERRRQLTQHHSAVHLVNGICRKMLGTHSWQCGAAKTPEKARLDITHYDLLDDKTLKKIEQLANDAIKKSLKVEKLVMPREKAEEKYGYVIYQGGHVPGRNLRIVKIADLDVEACGGTHVDNTKEIEQVKLLSCTKIQDGVIRLTLVAGNAAKMAEVGAAGIIAETAKILGVPKEAVPSRAGELFEKWRIARKAAKKSAIGKIDLQLRAAEKRNLNDGELLRLTAKVFSTQPEHVAKTAKRFLSELDELRKKLG